MKKNRAHRTKKERFYIILSDQADGSKFFHFTNLEAFVSKYVDLFNDSSLDNERIYVFERMLPLDYFSNLTQLPF